MNLTRLSSLLATLAIMVILLPMAAVVFVYAHEAADGQSYSIDFGAFWGAARLAVEGNGVGAFNQPTLATAMDAAHGTTPKDYLWLYPPMFHLVIAPLGWLPFWVAYPLFTLTVLTLYLLALRPYADAWPGGLNLALAAPVVVIGALNGNNGLLTSGLLLLAFHALSEGRETRAGLLISLLTIKPTLGILLPFVLIAGGHWRAFVAALWGALAFAGVATWVFGWDYWPAFFEAASDAGQKISAGNFPLEVTVTWFGLLKALGVEGGIAFAAQGVVLALCCGVAAWAFARPDEWAWKGAILLMLTPLATPYAHYYELAFTLAGTMLLSLAGGVRSVPEKALVLALWILPATVIFVRDPPVAALLGAPLAATLVILAVLRAHRAWA